MPEQRLRTPPHSAEAEQAVLGGILLDASAYDEIADQLREDDFYRHDHRLVFRAIAALAGEDRPLDVITVTEWLERHGVLEEAGGLAYVGVLAKDAPGAANIRAYADTVRERAVLRQLIRHGNDIAQIAFNPEGRDVNEVIEHAQALVLDVERGAGRGPRRIHLGYMPFLEALDERAHAEGGMIGLSTGFKDIDDKTLGMERGDVWIVAARPSMGKTTFAMNIAENVAAAGSSTLVYSLEMPEAQLLMRMIASMERIDFGKLRKGDLDQLDWERVIAAREKLAKLPLLIDDQPALTMTEIRARARRVKRREGLDLIVIDFLQLIRSTGDNRTHEITKITGELKRLAKELDVPVVALSQLNRGLEARRDKRPIMADLRDSGSIEQDADVVLFPYREAAYERNCEFDYVAELDIAKQRNGPTGQVLLHYAGSLMRFGNLDQMDASNYRSWLREKNLRAVGTAKGFDE